MKFPEGYLGFKKMLLVSPIDNNRWIYMMDGLQKPMDHVSAGGVMAGSVATLAIVWLSLQTMGLFGYSNSIGAYKLPVSLQNYLPGYNDAPAPGLSSANYFSGIVDTGLFSNNKPMPRIDEEALNTSISFAQTSIDRMSLLETNIINAGIRLETHSPEHKQYLSSYPLDDAFDKGIDAILIAKASSYLLLGNCQRFGISKVDCARFLSTMKLDGIPFGKTCMAAQNVVCNLKAKYRSIDGSCNNVDNPSWGSAMTAYTRVLFPHYSDGIQAPRHVGDTKKPLPNPRAVSVSLSRPTDQSDITRTLAVMQWSQFVAHDVSQTPVRKMISTGAPISCCESNGNNLSPRYMHPDCAAIEIPSNDPIYSKNYVRCMNYVRSLPVLKSDCTMGPIEQMNQVSHFLDGSTIYGSTLEKSRKLRKFEKGLLLVNVVNNHDYLTNAGIDLAAQCKESCYASGDDRINVEPQLAVIHTIWHREHNRIAKELAKLNPEWSDEILYQEARRIVIAEIQHITYNEWLPILLGKTYVRAAGLYMTASYSRNYNSDDDPSVSNEVAAAAFEFLYSLVQGEVRMPDESRQINNTLELSEYFFKPHVIETDDVFDGLLRGLATQTVQKMDTNVVEAVSSKLFKTNNKEFGLDAISLAIQRGRDHGLPGYNHYRKHCGLPAAKKFDDFLDYIPTEMVQKLRTTYSHPNDVDLIIGGLAERPADDGLIGPTFSCIIAEQFARTRRTDRFFYDSAAQPRPFTLDQLTELRNVTLARIFCDNGNNIQNMQPNVFIKPQKGNQLTSCQDFEAIPSVDLFAWAEKAKAYR